jgi:protein-S-isoprenylcysteine O-methyltransferase Ste14
VSYSLYEKESNVSNNVPKMHAMGTPPFYLSAIAFFGVMNRIFCPYEENKLTAAFGEDYRSYAKRVRRWL